MDSKETFYVSPLGQYGHIYELTRPQYITYKCIGVATFVMVIVLGILAACAHLPFLAGLGFSPGTLTTLALLAASVGTFTALTNAHRGKKVTRPQVDISEPIGPAVNVLTAGIRILGIAGGIVFIAMGSFIIVVNLIAGETPSPLVILIVVVAVLILYMKTRK